MKITVTGRKIHITDGIRNHLNRKMNKTITDLDDKTDIYISLSVKKYRHFAELTLKKRPDLRIKKGSNLKNQILN